MNTPLWGPQLKKIYYKKILHSSEENKGASIKVEK